MDTPTVLWQPDPGVRTMMEEFQHAIAASGGPVTTQYQELWQWSVEEPNAFWLAVWEFFELSPPTAEPPPVALADASFPGATWFPGVRLNYAEVMLRMPGRDPQATMVVSLSQTRAPYQLSAAQLREQVGRARAGLVRLGVRAGDVVAAYAPNIAETLIFFLAAASLGATFSSCAPEFGVASVTDRLGQINPTVLLAVDGYRYGDKPIDRRAEVAQLQAQLPSITTVVWLPYLDSEAPPPVGAVTWTELTSHPGPLEFVAVEFDHPLYVLFSSGTTGLPKAIIHGHGGITIEHLKLLGLHHDLGPADRFFWFSTTGWMMWNLLVSGLGVGATIILWDGNPAWPDLGELWRMAAAEQITYFGVSAPFLLACRKAGLAPARLGDLSSLRGLGSTAAPLPAEGFHWVYAAVSPTVRLDSLSGGTDMCTGFVGGAPILPVTAGEISGRCLGAAVAAYDEAGRPQINQVGELVIEKPMPSMPVGFVNDPDGSRYFDAYFADIPGVWRHGDWLTITERGTCVITGRSDATLNRGGVRLGTAEFYSVIDTLPHISDSLVVHLEDPAGGAGTLIVFVQPQPGLSPAQLQELDTQLRRTLHTELSPRHVPDLIHHVAVLPHTLSGKRIEVPVKRILQGTPVDEAVSAGALTHPEALQQFVSFREQLPNRGA